MVTTSGDFESRMNTASIACVTCIRCHKIGIYRVCLKTNKPVYQRYYCDRWSPDYVMMSLMHIEENPQVMIVCQNCRSYNTCKSTTETCGDWEPRKDILKSL